jgi:hydrogenase maturation factor HypE
MPDGEIYFKTVQIGALDIVPIKDGKFQGQAQSGARTVEIYSFREGMSEEAKKMYGDKAPPGMGTSKENVIPAKWNAESKLTAEVKETGANEFKFEITAK